jgi:acetyl esterase
LKLNAVLENVRRYRTATGFTPLYTMSVADARAADLATEQALLGSDREAVGEVLDVTWPGPAGPLPVRIYRPAGEGPFPSLVYFYGGGWVLGSVDTSDVVCRALTNAVRCVTFSVGYRLAPEAPFPAAVQDCYAAVRWVAENAASYGADGSRLAVAGDSSGGNLAAVSTLLARDGDGPSITAQALIYPATMADADNDSMREVVDPMFFNAHSVRWYWQQYLADPGDARSPLASPLLAADHGGLPRALVLTAECCPVRDEGRAYADVLNRAGVPVEHRCYPGVPHGFLAMASMLAEAREAMSWVAGFLAAALASPDA